MIAQGLGQADPQEAARGCPGFACILRLPGRLNAYVPRDELGIKSVDLHRPSGLTRSEDSRVGRAVHALGMRAGIEITVTPEDRRRLEAIARDRNAKLKHVARAKVILATADGCGTMEVMRRSGLSKPAVWRWQERFMHEGVDGLLRDKTRPPGKPRLPDETVRRVLDLTLSEPPGEATHWTGRMMARVSGVSLRSVQRIWAAHGLEPHRIRTFKLSRDPQLAERLKDVVGLSVDPPAHAVVLSVDEKSQIQALERTQPGLPLKPGRPATRTHDYVRHGTTTLFAALNVLEGTVLGRCMQRHRHQEFIRFLNAIEAAVPAGGSCM